MSTAATASAAAATRTRVPHRRQSLRKRINSVVLSAIVFAALSAALEPLGMPALTAPFVLVVWIFLLASPIFPRIRTVASP